MAKQNLTSKHNEPGAVKSAIIFSNDPESELKSADILPGIVDLLYEENILSDSITVTLTYTDAGGSMGGEGTIRELLPIFWTERVELEIKDSNNKSPSKGVMSFYVDKLTPMLDDSGKTLNKLTLKSFEFFSNHSASLSDKFEGKISDNIRKILKGNIKTEKKLDIEETLNNCTFYGNNWKPFYTLNWLSKRAIPSIKDSEGRTAGFFLFETGRGFHFKSIDSLFDKEKNPRKKTILYNSTSEKIPTGYDVKALEYSKDTSQGSTKLMMGAYKNRTLLFDPFTCYYEMKPADSDQNEKGTVSSGKKVPKINTDFQADSFTGQSEVRNPFTRTSYYLVDRGTNTSGNITEQLKESRNENKYYRDIASQSMMRYNQVFASKIIITIEGDFTLHAGDMIYVDTPSVGTSTKKRDKVNKQDGGLYIISGLSHYMNPVGTFTKLELIRDSIGRKGKHTENSVLES